MLGPLLFIFYMLLLYIIIHCHDLHLSCYANDTQLYVSTKSITTATFSTLNCLTEIESWRKAKLCYGTSKVLNKHSQLCLWLALPLLHHPCLPEPPVGPCLTKRSNSVVLFTEKAIHNQGPLYFTILFHNHTPFCCLCSFDANLLSLPHYHSGGSI